MLKVLEQFTKKKVTLFGSNLNFTITLIKVDTGKGIIYGNRDVGGTQMLYVVNMNQLTGFYVDETHIPDTFTLAPESTSTYVG